MFKDEFNNLLPIKLSENFTLGEFIKSYKAFELNIINYPDVVSIVKLSILCNLVLQPLRDLIDEPIIINSGYRNEKLNEAVGGQPNSQHRYGYAADIRCKGLQPIELAKIILNEEIPYDQMILLSNKYLHISYVSRTKNRLMARQYANQKKTKLIKLQVA